MEQVGTAVDFIAERWGIAADPEPLRLGLLVAVVLALTLYPGSWRILSQASTIVHEMGHVFVAILTGRKVSGIRLHADSSGVTTSRGRGQGPGLLMTFLAGYPAPGVLAVGLTWLAVAGHSGAALTVFQVVLLLALLLSRNFVGILSCLLAVLAVGAIWWWNEPTVVVYTVAGLGIFYALAGVRDTWGLCRIHASGRGKSSGTDAAQAARAWRMLPLPAWFWLLFFLVLSLGSAAVVGWMLFG